MIRRTPRQFTSAPNGVPLIDDKSDYMNRNEDVIVKLINE